MTPDGLRESADGVIYSASVDYELRAETYRGAISRLHDALRSRADASELWPACDAACEAEHALTDTEGPAGALYRELGIPDCYDRATCPRAVQTSAYCREMCPLRAK